MYDSMYKYVYLLYNMHYTRAQKPLEEKTPAEVGRGGVSPRKKPVSVVKHNRALHCR